MKQLTAERPATAQAIIESAERLFGRYGINGISLRKIALEAGSANKYAVQYYFRNRDGLLQAIFDYRLPLLEERRKALLDDAGNAGGVTSVRDFLHIIFQPLAEQIDSQGNHSYAAFLVGLAHFGNVAERSKLNDFTPVTGRVIGMLDERLVHVSSAHFLQRMEAVRDMILGVLARNATTRLEGKLDDALDMGAAALLAEPS